MSHFNLTTFKILQDFIFVFAVTSPLILYDFYAFDIYLNFKMSLASPNTSLNAPVTNI